MRSANVYLSLILFESQQGIYIIVDFCSSPQLLGILVFFIPTVMRVIESSLSLHALVAKGLGGFCFPTFLPPIPAGLASAVW